MKVILTGGTGFIGSNVLQRCLAHPQITTVIVLSRRPLENITHPKLQVEILENFLTYPPELLAKLSGAAACLWCLGTPTSSREVVVDYTMAAANAFRTHLAPVLRTKEQGQEAGGRFTFIYLSGALVEKDLDKTLRFMPQARKARGQLQMELIALEEGHEEAWHSVNVRPAGVTSSPTALSRFALLGWYIPVQELAAAFADIAITGEAEGFVENVELRARGQKALEAVP